MLIRLTQFAILFFIIATTVFFVFLRSDKTAADSYIKPNDTQVVTDDFADNDGDGIPNWEEALYGTSINSVDERGDRVTNSNDATVVTEPTTDYVFTPEGSNLLDLEQLTQTLLSGEVPDDINNLLNQENQTGSQTEWDISNQQITEQINTLGVIVGRSVTSDRTDSQSLVAYLNGDSTDATDVGQLISLYANAANSIAQTKKMHIEIEPHKQRLQVAYNTIAASLQSVVDMRKNPGTFEQETFEQNMQSFSNASEQWQQATVSLFRVIQIRQLQFEAGDGGKFFSFAP